MIGLDALLQKAQNLEPLPASATRLAALVSKPDVKINEIMDVVSLDQALTMRLLRVANSAANAARMPIKTAREAVVRLGNATVLALAVAGAARRHLSVAIPAYGLSEDQLWRHSVAAALAVDKLTKHCKVPIPPEAFTSALLHDFGKLVLARFLTFQNLEGIAKAQTERGLSRLQAEQEVLGIDHAQLGRLIALRWGLPERIARGIQFHHSPDAGNDVVCDLVAVANQTAKGLKDAKMPEDSHPDDFTAAKGRLGLSETGLVEGAVQLALDFNETIAQFA